MSDFFIETTIAGVTFEGRQKLLELEEAGNRIFFRREPKNKYDKNAIAVFSVEQQKQLGYIPRQVAVQLAPIIDSGISVKGTVESIGRVEGGYGPLGASIEITWSGRR